MNCSMTEEIPPNLPQIPPSTVSARPVPLALLAGRGNRKSFSRKCEALECLKIYNAAELQFATKGFSEENIICEGSLGPVYEAKLPDGQVKPPINSHDCSSQIAPMEV